MKKVEEVLLGGLASTAALLAVVYLEHFLDMINDNPATFSALLFGEKQWIGIILYGSTGLIFAFFYNVVFSRILGWVRRDWARGALYGVVLAILIEISLFMTAGQEFSSFLIMNVLSTILAYVVYGIVLGVTVRGENG